jgi:hypothetical protein
VIPGIGQFDTRQDRHVAAERTIYEALMANLTVLGDDPYGVKPDELSQIRRRPS